MAGLWMSCTEGPCQHMHTNIYLSLPDSMTNYVGGYFARSCGWKDGSTQLVQVT